MKKDGLMPDGRQKEMCHIVYIVTQFVYRNTQSAVVQ